MVKTVVLARDTSIPLKDFRAQLIGAESAIEARITTLASGIAAMYIQGDHSKGGNHSQGESSNAESRSGDNQGYQGNNRFHNRNGYNFSQFYNKNGYGSFNNSMPYYNGNR
ncbi:hypothetical protein C1H46_024083 [Malus baccata]|uniref:Uncharacterized protein n=1 Tax=Malus baccata TaxID=106549 RepID=A0A540LV59_MALBA|nr:hypothetical protein C1H46_024083 [Malus baccata]